ncbi:MAG TPA: hypothetical protein VN376_05520 [Longilinea sp.]|nr:hypothetical protein [Longilinea sp.]
MLETDVLVKELRMDLKKSVRQPAPLPNDRKVMEVIVVEKKEIKEDLVNRVIKRIEKL